MKILFIDDMPEDREWIMLRERPDADITYATTSEQALELLTSQAWDEIWWDHDLGYNDTTMRIAETLAELAFNDAINPPKFAKNIIHTMNPVGRKNLAMILARWRYRVDHYFMEPNNEPT